MEKNPCTITIGPVRFSYLKCWQPEAMTEGQPKKYSVSCIIPKSDKGTIKQINDAIEHAKQAGKEKTWKGKIPGTLKLPLRDGDKDENRSQDAAYQGAMFINANATTRPGIVGPDRKPLLNEDDIYSGAYGYVNITLYPFNNGGAVGVAAGFNHIMKTKDGEPLSGRISVDAAFEDLGDLNDGAAPLM
jgi:hypothetical protein